MHLEWLGNVTTWHSLFLGEDEKKCFSLLSLDVYANDQECQVPFDHSRTTLFEDFSNRRIWIFRFEHFPPIFVLLKLTSLITLFDRSGNTVWLAKFASLPILNVNFSMILNHCDVPGIRRFPSRCGWLFWWRGTSRGIWPHERSRFAHLVCKHYVRWSRCESPVFVWKISAKNDKNVEGHLLKSSLLLDNFPPSPQTNTCCRSTSDTDLIPELWAIKSTAWMAKTVMV